jgi:hypothetical protein
VNRRLNTFNQLTERVQRAAAQQILGSHSGPGALSAPLPCLLSAFIGVNRRLNTFDQLTERVQHAAAEHILGSPSSPESPSCHCFVSFPRESAAKYFS